MRKYYYEGICDKFGGYPKGTAIVIGASWLLGQALNTAFNLASGAADMFSNAELMNYATLGGAFIGVAMHSLLNSKLPHFKIDNVTGSKIVRTTQAVCYAIPVAAALAFNAMSEKDLMDDYVKPLAAGADYPDQKEHRAPVQSPSQFRLL